MEAVITYKVDLGPTFAVQEGFKTLELAEKFIEIEKNGITFSSHISPENKKYWKKIYDEAKIYQVETKVTLIK